MKVKASIVDSEDCPGGQEVFDLDKREEVKGFMDFCWRAGEANVDVYLEEVE